MSENEVRTSHEDVVDAVRKALKEVARKAYDNPSNNANYTLMLSQAYERIQSASQSN